MSKIEKTLSFDGEKLTPEVGAECCFSQETYRDKNNYQLSNETNFTAGKTDITA